MPRKLRHVTALLTFFFRFSELGDKTFFIAAIMAMRHPRITILTGAMAALGIMHVMSAFFGALALKVVPKVHNPKI